jgi:hypothetical protein
MLGPELQSLNFCAVMLLSSEVWAALILAQMKMWYLETSYALMPLGLK